MSKRDLLIDLHVHRAELSRALLGISADEWETAAVSGDWTPRDVVAHIAAWDRWVYTVARHLSAGRPLPADLTAIQTDSFNARAVVERHHWPLKQLLDDFIVARRQLIVLIAGLREEVLGREQTVAGESWTIAGLAQSLIDHDQEHSNQLTSWKKARGASKVPGPKLILQIALETNRSALLSLLDAIPADERTRLEVNGTWTAKDLCGHIADWDAFVVDVILKYERHEPIAFPPGDYGEGWNQEHARRRRDQPWEKVWQDFINHRGTIVTELQERIGEADLAAVLPSPWSGESSLYRWFFIPCFHDAEHAETLLAWYQQQKPAGS